MRHIKKFNEELSPRIYNNAARKLDKMNMPKRADALKAWSKEQKLRENMNRWRENVRDFRDFGTFKFTIKDKSGNILVTDDFYLSIDFDSDAFEDEVQCQKESENTDFHFFLMTGLIPTNEETIKKCNEVLPDSDDLTNGFYWANCISLVMNGDNKITLSDLKFEPYDPSVSGYPVPTDRRTAVKLRNLLKSIFDDKINYPSGRTDVEYMYEHLENTILNRCGFSGDYGFELKEISDFIQSSHVTAFPGFIES